MAAHVPGGRLADFDDAMDQGVSSHLCDALALLGGDDKDRTFGIGFTWAPTLPVEDEDQAAPREISFAAGSARVLAEAADYLREIEQAGEAEITGRVVATESTSLHAGGAVKVEGVLMPSANTRRRKVWVRLGPEGYQQALDAHRSDTPVRASGHFQRRDNRQELRADLFGPQ